MSTYTTCNVKLLSIKVDIMKILLFREEIMFLQLITPIFRYED